MNRCRYKLADWRLGHTGAHDIPWKPFDGGHSAGHVVAKLPPTFSHARPPSIVLASFTLLALCTGQDFTHDVFLNTSPWCLISARLELVSLSEIDNPTSGRVFFHEVASYHVGKHDFAVPRIDTDHLLGVDRIKEESVVYRVL